MKRFTAGALLAALSVLAVGCGSGGPDGGRELVVFAAASLTEAFGELGATFEAEHEGVTVTFNFGPSDGLATQIQEGGPADVFASASPRWMDAVADDPGIGGRTDFARNRLVVLTPADDPAGIDAVEDLARPGVKLVLAAEDVPAGGYARRVLEAAGILDEALANLVSNEEDVKGVVQKVLAGEADAGIVYVTDVTDQVAPDVRTVDIPDDVDVIATYPIAWVVGTAHRGLAARFIALVTSPQGQDVLARHGFLPAP